MILSAPGSLSFLRQLQPGDVLLYARGGVFGRLISIKTWSRFTHVEIVGFSESLFEGDPDPVGIIGSRNGEGVAWYDPNWEGLALVLRPTSAVDAPAANTWADTVLGQGYDWLGLINFTYARVVGRDNGKMFCSEFATRWLRRAGVPIFPYIDADTIAPADFVKTGRLQTVWRSPDEWERYTRWIEQEDIHVDDPR